MNSDNLDADSGRPPNERTKHNTVFVIRIRAAPDRDPYRELKGMLKIAWRRHGLKALSVTEEKSEALR
jgi:hypothetical protein